MHQFLTFADKHPETAVVMSICATVIAVLTYKMVVLFLDTVLSLVGRQRTVRRVNKQTVTPAKTELTSSEPESNPGSLPEIKAALSELGFAKREYEPVLAQVDLSQDIQSVLKAALRKLAMQKQAIA